MSDTTSSSSEAAAPAPAAGSSGGGGEQADNKASPFPTWTFDEPCARMEWNRLSDVELRAVAGTEAANSLDEADLVLLGTTAPPAKDEDDEDGSEEEAMKDEEAEQEEASRLSSPTARRIDEDALGGALTSLLQENAKSFKNGATVGTFTPTLRTVLDKKTRRYAVLGLGAEPKPDGGGDALTPSDSFASSGHALGKAVAEKCDSEKKVGAVAVVLPAKIAGTDSVVRDFAAAFYHALYSDNRYRTGKNVKKMAEDLKIVTIVSEEEGGEAEPAAIASPDAIDKGRKLAQGVILAKDIVNSPHNVLNSLSLADTARRIAAKSKDGCIRCEILDKDACEKRGMGSYLGVARGSETPPQFIHLTYSPPDEDAVILRKVGIVGKGLLFDTGGYNVKVQMMEKMKFDCGGAAAVLGAARAVGEIQPPGVEAHFIVAACENMINDRAYVPSDILTASNGKTIEVLNTDAEGRLTLADALVFADKEVGCEKIIELSTLTGACILALGTDLCGIWTSNDELANELREASKVTGDKSWRMPMEKAYEEALASKIADLSNIGSTRFGGAIHAALFLQNFVTKKKPFAHIDIAGPAWDWKNSTASGYGTKLVTEWIQQQGLP